jgi:2-phosphoglycerate kinase
MERRKKLRHENFVQINKGGSYMKTKLIFIAGVPGTGKSTISLMLALKERTDRIISLDTFKIIIKEFVKESENPYLYSTTHESYKIENLNIIDGFKKHSKSIGDYVVSIVSKLTNERMIIIEGAQLLPDIMSEFDEKKFDMYYFNLFIDSEDKLFERYDSKCIQRIANWRENIDKILNIQDYLLSNKNVMNIDSQNIGYAYKKILEAIA